MIYTSGGAGVTFVEASRTAGDVTLNTTGIVTAYDTSTDLVVPAAAGDRVIFGLSMLTNGGFNSGAQGIDIVTVPNGTITTYVSSRGAAPAANGLASLYTDATFVISGQADYVVAAGDLAGGNVTFRLVYTNTTPTRTIYGSANYPFRWWALNVGH